MVKAAVSVEHAHGVLGCGPVNSDDEQRSVVLRQLCRLPACDEGQEPGGGEGTDGRVVTNRALDGASLCHRFTVPGKPGAAVS